MTARAPQSCWEFWECKPEVRDKCAAYQNDSGRECWLIAGSHSKSPSCPKLKNRFSGCWECPWFRKLNPGFDQTTSVQASAGKRARKTI